MDQQVLGKEGGRLMKGQQAAGGLSGREMLGARESGGLPLSGASWGWEKLVATSLAGVSPPSLIANKR